MVRTEKGVVIGNTYLKYSTRNPIARFLVDHFIKVLDEMVYSINPEHIHEVGCGEGELISRYVDGRRRLTASDFSQEIIREARERYKSTDIHFKVSGIYSLTEEDAADCILCIEMLEHLEDPKRGLRILADLADPYLIISVPREPIWRFVNMLRGAYLKDFGNTPGHLQHWSRRDFISLLQPFFEIVLVRSPFPWTIALCRRRE
ncbi:MAG: class I SAM-dependent methyltransferase [Anaerolineales bacterium]|nr:class I SAM-dependent methyltransferase [Anaerolineales bacterium]